MNMKFFNIIVLSILVLLSCKKNADFDTDFSNLKDNQIKFRLSLDNQDFYEPDAIFTGHLDARDNFLGLNCFNQYGGNFMLTLDGNFWYKKEFVEGKGGYSFSSLMFGKVTDKAKQKGAGYLLSTGRIEPIVMTKSKIILKVYGKAKKYPNVLETDPSFDFDGVIVAKNPKFDNYSITK